MKLLNTDSLLKKTALWAVVLVLGTAMLSWRQWTTARQQIEPLQANEISQVYSEFWNGQQDSWAEDGTYTIIGVETRLVKGVKAAANIRQTTNDVNDVKDNAFYLNLEYNF